MATRAGGLCQCVGMAAPTLEQIDAAILECLTFKRTRIMDRDFEYQDLDALRRLRAEVAARESMAAGTMFLPVQFVAKGGGAET